MGDLLREKQVAEGARFVDYAGRQAAADFGAAGDEASAVRSAVGLIDLSWRSLLRFTGDDRAAFLHSMTTNHVLDLPAGALQPTTCCDATGHLVGVLTLINTGDAYWAEMHPGCAEDVMTILDKHLVMEDVEIAEIHGAWGILSLQGPSAQSALQSVVGPGLTLPGPFQIREWSANGEPAYLLWISHTGEHGFGILAPRETLPGLWTQLLGAVREHGGRPVGLDALNALRIEAGIPWWGEDLDHSLLALEAGMEDWVHYAKGCYLGQETLARIHFRGRTNRQLMGLSLSNIAGLPSRGVRLHSEDREAGWVTSAVQSPTLGRPIALGFVRREFLTPGTPLTLEDGDEAVVTELPFVRGH